MLFSTAVSGKRLKRWNKNIFTILTKRENIRKVTTIAYRSGGQRFSRAFHLARDISTVTFRRTTSSEILSLQPPVLLNSYVRPNKTYVHPPWTPRAMPLNLIFHVRTGENTTKNRNLPTTTICWFVAVNLVARRGRRQSTTKIIQKKSKPIYLRLRFIPHRLGQLL